jgi:hypothetical protein
MENFRIVRRNKHTGKIIGHDQYKVSDLESVVYTDKFFNHWLFGSARRKAAEQVFKAIRAFAK